MKFLDLLYSDHVIELLMLVPFTLILGFMVYNVCEILEQFSDHKED